MNLAHGVARTTAARGVRATHGMLRLRIHIQHHNSTNSQTKWKKERKQLLWNGVSQSLNNLK